MINIKPSIVLKTIPLEKNSGPIHHMMKQNDITYHQHFEKGISTTTGAIVIV